MFLKDYQKMIVKVQSKNKDVEIYPQLLEVCEPGKTGFQIRKGSKSILISVLEVEARELSKGIIIPADVKAKLKKENAKQMEDAMGVFPFMAVVMESDSEAFIPGDIVYYDPEQVNSHGTKTIVVKQAVAMLVTEYTLLGTIDKI